MSEETPEIEGTEEKPKRPRRRRKASAETSGAEGSSATESAAEASPPADSEAEAPSAESEPVAEALEAESPDSEKAKEPSATVAPQAEEEPEAEPDEEPEAEADEGPEAEADEEPEATEEPERPARRRGAAAQPAPRRGRRRREVPDVTVRAQAKYVRSSARKARLVCDHIRGKSVNEARAILSHTPRAIARDWSKLLESAVANAEHNHELIGEDLYVKAVQADEGPTIKRYRPRALGRATRIRKRTSHLTILLKPKQH